MNNKNEYLMCSSKLYVYREMNKFITYIFKNKNVTHTYYLSTRSARHALVNHISHLVISVIGIKNELKGDNKINEAI